MTVAAAAEELVGLLVGLYGDGLGRIVAVLGEQGEAGEAMLAKLADDPLVESLLLLHGLHPLDVDARDPARARPGPALPRLACGRGGVPRRDRRRGQAAA